MKLNAIILVAGRSRRLRALTSQPKCLLRFGEKRLIDIQIAALEAHGISKIHFVLGYKSEVIKKYLNEHYPENNFNFIMNPQWRKCNVLGSLYFAKNILKQGAIVLHGDTLLPLNIFKSFPTKVANGINLMVQKKKCREEEMKYILKDGTDSEQILFLSKSIIPTQAVGEFMGISQISPSFGEKMSIILESLPYRTFCNEYYEWALLQVSMFYKLPLFRVDVTEHPMIEIDFPEDYKMAVKIFSSKKFQK